MAAARHPSTSVRTLISAAAAALLALVVVVAPGPAADATTRSVAAEGAFESAPCVVELPLSQQDRVRCGYLTVPERRSEGADPERVLRLPVAIVTSRSRTPVADPVVVPLTGSGLARLPELVSEVNWAAADRDVILIEQRGGSSSQPSLDCPELSVWSAVSDGALLTGAERDARDLGALQRCRERLIEAGGDPAPYTTAASAADLAELRGALGYDAWNLFARSAATRIALTTVRDQSEGLRAVVLDGVVPPHLNGAELAPQGLRSALDALIAACDADDDCAARYPDTEGSLTTLLADATDAPLTVPVHAPSGETVAVTVTDRDLARGLAAALQSDDAVRVLPFAIDEAARGNLDALAPFVQAAVDEAAAPVSGAALTRECADELPFVDDARAEDAGADDPLAARLATAPATRAWCEVWDVPASGASENALVSSGVPALLLSGGLDAITPATWAEAAASGLSAAVTLTFPSLGHGVLGRGPATDCPSALATAFLADPSTAPDTACIERMRPPDFLTTSDIDPLSAPTRTGDAVFGGRDAVQTGIAVAFVIALLATLAYGIVHGLLWLARRRGSAPEGAVLAATLSSACNLGFIGGLLAVASRSDPLVIAFGLPPVVWPLLLLPFVSLVLTAVLVVLLVRAWMGGDGTTGHRVALSLAAVTSLGFAVWLLSWGLLTL